MTEFVSYILDKSAWLYTRIYQNEFFFFDLWSILHLLSGFAIFMSLRAMHSKRPLVILISILVLYEIVEILFAYFAFNIFRPETIKDQFTDIFIGIAGGLLCSLYLSFAGSSGSKKQIPALLILMLVASFTYAFIWTGFYQYHYNVDSYNTPGINWSTVSAWTSAGMLILLLFSFLPLKHITVRVIFSWLGYFISLLIFEYFYYYILEVRETSGIPLKPLIFGLVHGTRKLHVFYLIAPFLIISLFSFGKWLLNLAIKTKAQKS